MICHFRNLFVNIQSLLIADFILDEFHIFPPLSKYCIFVSVTHYFSIHFNSSTIILFFPAFLFIVIYICCIQCHSFAGRCYFCYNIIKKED